MRDNCLVCNMNLPRSLRAAGVTLLAAALILPTTTATAVPQAGKKITCYKGTAKKVVTTAKCPAGWSTKKPAAATSAKTVALNATYKGDIAMVWSSSDVKATDVVGTSGDATLPKLKATGASSPQSQCSAIYGSGTLAGTDGTVTFKMDSTTKGCAAAEAAPTAVLVDGVATITGGTGKFAGATGSLTVKGNFNVKSTAAGFKETQTFSATFTGTIKLK